MGNSRTRKWISSLALLIAAWTAASVSAQERARRDGEAASRPNAAAHTPDDAAANVDPAPSQLDRDFAGPDPSRPWGRGRYLYQHRDRYYGPGPWGGHARRYRRTPYAARYGRYYYDDFTYRFGVPAQYDRRSDDLERAYRQGVADGRDFERFEIQAERGLDTYQNSMQRGQESFAAGEYGAAARHYRLAATLNQGDPASRLSAAYAQIALGQFEPAAALLRRAFELQPKIAYLPLDPQAAYANPEDFWRHLKTLRDAAKNTEDHPELWFTLGVCLHFTGDAGGASEAFDEAARLVPEDALFKRMAKLATDTLPPRPEKSQPRMGER